MYRCIDFMILSYAGLLPRCIGQRDLALREQIPTVPNYPVAGIFAPMEKTPNHRKRKFGVFLTSQRTPRRQVNPLKVW
jgi:hypothetical protein